MLSALFLLFGIAIASSGLYWLHVINKANSVIERVSAILYTMVGCFFIWTGVAYMVPPVIDERLSVVDSKEKWSVVKLTFNPVRNCKTENFTAILIYGNNHIEVPALMITHGDTNTKSSIVKFVYIGFINPLEGTAEPDSVFIQSTHTCTLGFTFTTDSPTAKFTGPKTQGLLNF